MMGKKRRHAEIDQSHNELASNEPSTDEPSQKVHEEIPETTIGQAEQHIETEKSFNSHRQKKIKQVYSRVSVDPSRRYHVPESRESWGPNVKGKKFRKEKGKKKRCPNAGVRIDGSVKSIRFDT